MDINTAQLTVPAAILGVSLHLGHFNRGEHFTEGLPLLFLTTGLSSLATAVLTFYAGLSLFDSIGVVFTVFGSFVAGLLASTVTYRLLFHPLKGYPGPVGAKVSKLWHSWKNATGINTFELFDQLHHQYGDWVRSGSNELSIIDPAIVEALYGTHSPSIKTEWYDVSLPMTTLHQMRDRGLHDRRRRGGWEKAFNGKSLRAYDPRIIGHTDTLIRQLAATDGNPTNASKWFHYYGYDVMGSLGFGRSFRTLESGESHFAIDIVNAGQGVFLCLSPLSWFIYMFTRLPSALNPITKLLEYSNECVQERKRQGEDESDIIGHLIEHEKFFEGRPDLDSMLLTGDARLIIVAGSDTTSAALVFAFHYIASDKSIADKVRAELSENGIVNDASFAIPSLQNLPYLNGLIQEVLRLHPPVPAGVFRQTPPEGLQVGNRFIPGNVKIIVPHYSIMRSPKSFAKPNELIPERWTSQPELVLNKNGFLPFSTGPYGCIGKHLALAELRTVIAKILLTFDVTIAPGTNSTEVFTKTKDVFTVLPGPLHLCFMRR